MKLDVGCMERKMKMTMNERKLKVLKSIVYELWDKYFETGDEVYMDIADSIETQIRYPLIKEVGLSMQKVEMVN